MNNNYTMKNADNEHRNMMFLPDGTAMTYAECIDNLLYSRDMDMYLDILFMFRKQYLIVLSVKDIIGHKMPESVYNKIHKLGFSKLTKWMGRTYVGVIDRGVVKYDQLSEKAGLSTECNYENETVTLSIKSQAHTWGVSEIIINGINYSMNCRGWNIVIFDYGNERVIDSSTYDSYVDHPTFYHGDLTFDKNYFDHHFFIPEKYKDIWRSAYQKSYFSNEKLQARELDNGIVLPNKVIDGRVYGGVCDENFTFFDGHQTHQKEAGARVRYISGSYVVETEDIEYLDENVVYGGPMMNHLGHLIVELFLTRMWWYLNNPDKSLKIALTLYTGSSTKATNFIVEFFEFFGISKEQLIFVDKPTRFKKIVVPDQCIVPSHVQVPYIFTKEFVEQFEKIRSNIRPSKYEKVYFSKTMSARNNFVGEDYFVDFYKKKGYQIIFPEEHTLREKAEFLAGADEFATTIGTNAHFAIFCKPTAKITFLSRTDYMPHPVQAIINNAIKNKNIYYVNTSLGFFHKYDWDGLSFMGVTKEFKKYVKEVFNEDLDITTEEYLRSNVYDYFLRILQYYSNPSNFNYLKNQKMITILRNMSEVFLGKDFDTSHLDLTTNEDNLQCRISQLSSELNTAKERISELENTHGGKVSMAMDDGISKLAKQINELQKTFDEIKRLM